MGSIRWAGVRHLKVSGADDDGARWQHRRLGSIPGRSSLLRRGGHNRRIRGLPWGPGLLRFRFLLEGRRPETVRSG